MEKRDHLLLHLRQPRGQDRWEPTLAGRHVPGGPAGDQGRLHNDKCLLAPPILFAYPTKLAVLPSPTLRRLRARGQDMWEPALAGRRVPGGPVGDPRDDCRTTGASRRHPSRSLTPPNACFSHVCALLFPGTRYRFLGGMHACLMHRHRERHLRFGARE